MRNRQLKTGYNLQIGVISEYICAYDIFSNPLYFEKLKTRKFKNDLNKVENLIYNYEENRLFRKDGLKLKFLHSSKNGKKQYFFNPET